MAQVSTDFFFCSVNKLGNKVPKKSEIYVLLFFRTVY
jgi:hypothetical protein